MTKNYFDKKLNLEYNMWDIRGIRRNINGKEKNRWCLHGRRGYCCNSNFYSFILILFFFLVLGIIYIK